LIESMSCGVVPVCSDIPPHRFIVGDHGVPWQPGTVQACANACMQARHLIGTCSRGAIRRHFEVHLSYPSIAGQLLKAYRRLVG
jgi:hypothetical protein